ncbi:MAG: HD domain-containing protein [Clostridia bacterium]|nr:HD domain-containing protein [Clostridia bacterium]
MNVKDEFVEIYQRCIKREGADRLLQHLMSPASDFFTAPASTRFHGAYEGGLAEHSINVYECLKDYLERERVKELYGIEASEETIAIVSLLHDLCKMNFYKPGFRNAKDESGVWQKVPTYEVDDKLPYGHGEKSVYMISGFMRLTREEAFAIRYHMGFSGGEPAGNVGKAFEMFPLAFALSTADMEATYFIEGKN